MTWPGFRSHSPPMPQSLGARPTALLNSLIWRQTSECIKQKTIRHQTRGMSAIGSAPI